MNEDQGYTRKEAMLLGIFSLLLGAIYNYLFYGKETGLSAPLAVGMFYILFFWAMRHKIKHLMSFGGLLLIPIALLSLTYAFYSNPIFHALNHIAIPLLIAIQTTLMSRSSHHNWYDFSFIGHVLYQVIPHSIRQFPVPIKIFKANLQRKTGQGQYKVALKVLLGLLISLPILIVVVSLLISADQLFSEMMDNIPDYLGEWNAGEAIARIFLVLLAAFYIFSYVWGLLHPKLEEAMSEYQGATRDQIGLDPIVALTFLIVMNIVYVLFTAVQFSYLFGSGELLLPDGTTYAEHARKGFGQLVIVTIINYSILLTVIHFVHGGHKLMNGVRMLLSLLIGCTFVMLCSAFIRLSWYEQAYGYTYTRVLVHAFLIYLAVLLAITLVKIWRERMPLLKYALIVSIIAYVAINYINIDRMIVNNNIHRYEATGVIDIDYLSGLSYDAVPDLVELSMQQNPPVGLEEGLERIEKRLEQDSSWTSFSLAKYKAFKSLEQLE
jgi:hypothetical protein